MVSGDPAPTYVPKACNFLLMFIACACARWSQISGDPAPTYVPKACDFLLMFIACACAHWSQLSGDPAPTYVPKACDFLLMFIACACARWSQLSGDPAPTYALLPYVYGPPPLRPFLGLGVPPSLRSVSLSLKKVVLSRGNPCSI